MRLGRFTFTDATVASGAGAVLKDAQADGDQLAVRFHLVGTATELDPAVLHQWTNLPAAGQLDEPTVPFVAPTDRSDLDGAYRVGSARVLSYDVGGDQAEAEVAATLTRELSYASTYLEATLIGVERSNVQSAAGGTNNGWNYGVPPVGTKTTDIDYSMSFGPNTRTRDNEDGDIDVLMWGGDESGAQSLRYSLEPGDWYHGACRIDVDAPDSTTQVPLIGRQPHVRGGQSGWLLSNGTIRMRPAGADGELETSIYVDGSGWTSWKGWEVQSSSSAVYDTITSLAVLHNAPDMVTIRLVLAESANPEYAVALDVTVKRGHLLFECTLTSYDAAGSTPLGKVKRTTSEAGTMQTLTAVNYAMVATSDDADGVKYVVGSPRAIGGDPIVGGISRTASGTELPFVLGYTWAGASTWDDAESLFRQYCRPYYGRLEGIGR